MGTDSYTSKELHELGFDFLNPPASGIPWSKQYGRRMLKLKVNDIFSNWEVNGFHWTPDYENLPDLTFDELKARGLLT